MRHNWRDDGQLSCRKREMKAMIANTALDGHTTDIKMAEWGEVPSKPWAQNLICTNFPSLHIDRGAVEINMAREIIEPVFSRPTEVRVLFRKISSLTFVSLLEKRETKASSSCAANPCMRNRSADTCTGNRWRSVK